MLIIKGNFLKRCRSCISSFFKIFNKLPLIKPNNNLYFLWNIISILAIICTIFIFTIDLVMGV